MFPTLKTPRYQFRLHFKGRSFATPIDLPQRVGEDEARENLPHFANIATNLSGDVPIVAVSLYHYPSDATLDTIRLEA